MNVKSKKAIIGPVISVFVMVLIISILAGLTFLFVSQLKTNVIDTSVIDTVTVTNESGYINSTGYTLATAGAFQFASPTITLAINGTDGTTIVASNYTVSSVGVVTNTTDIADTTYEFVNFTYTYTFIGEDTAYQAVNDTEAAGATVVNYLSLIFLAVIFGAILTLVLRIILPYINLGKEMGGF